MTLTALLQSYGDAFAPLALLIVWIVGLLVYLIPTFVGAHKKNWGAIVALNVLLGWTVVGWVLALVWALTVDQKPVIVTAAPAPALAPPVLCASCGKYAAANAVFCQSCGARLATG